MNKIFLGNNSELLATLPDNSIDCVITSPPYFQQRQYNGLGIGNEETLDDYIGNMLAVFRECIRVIKPSGSVVFNIGDKYIDGSLLLVPWRFALAAQSDGIRLINELTWVKSNPTPRQDDRKLISATEPFFIFAKSKDYYFDKTAFRHTEGHARRNTENVGRQYFGMIKQSDLSDSEKDQARIALSAAIADVKNGVIADIRMKIRGIHALAYGGQDGGRNRQIAKQGYTIIRLHGEAMKRDVVECAVETIKGNKHPAVYPAALVKELINLLCPLNGIILDPFIGSGTTAMAARAAGRNYLGYEIDPEYHASALLRLSDSTEISPLISWN